MNRTDAVTRILFEAFPTAEVRLFYLLGYTAIGIFFWGVYVQIRKYRRGAALALDGSLWSRAGDMAGKVLSHRTVARRDHAAGGAHRLIFYGFALLFLGTATITLQYDILEPLFGIRFWQGRFYLVFSLVLDIAGIALLGGLLYMMYRRGWMKLPKLDYARPDRALGDPDFLRPGYRREDWAFLWILVIIGFTGFLLEAARLVWLHARPDVWGTRWWSPAGAAVAKALESAGLTAHGGGVLRLSLWWFHGLLALAFIALIPYTKVKHIFTSAASLLVRDPKSAQRLTRVPADQAAPGVAKITDFTWKQLLNLDACTKCGRCHEACPARAVGAPLSPRDVILSLREFANAALEAGNVPPAAELGVHGKSPGQVAMETLWSCRTCMACVEICPVAVEHVPIIVQMRRKLVEDGAMDPLLTKTLQTIHKTGNSFGESKRKRGSWTKALPFKVKDARKEPVDLLWFVGDYASFDPRNQRVTQIFATLLHEAGVDFGILYDAESNAGNDVRRVGEEGLYEVLAESNIAALAGATFQSIVTTDPHSYNTILNEYPDFGGKYPIEHYTTLLERLFAEGKLKVTRPLSFKTTFHDPCHLGRFNKGYEAPREVLRRLGCQLVDMKRCRDNSFCCGAGGGRIWIPDPVGSEKPAQNRMREAAAIPGLEVYVVSCPKDLTMFEDALKTTGNEGKFVVKELIELVREAVFMKILIAVKQVAALDEDFEIREDGRDVEEEYLIRDLNEWDDYSLEEAVKIKEASSGAVEVVVVSVAPEDADEALRKCLAKGADRAIRVWDDGLEESDPIAIARVLAAVAKSESPDMLFAGVQSSDQTFAATGIATAAFLGWPHAAVVSSLDYAPGARSAVCRRELEGGLLQEVAIQCPAVLTIQLGINTPRYASLRSIKQAAAKPIEQKTLAALHLSAGDVGAAGSHSHVRRMYIPEKGRAELIEGDAAAKARRLAEIIREFRGDAA